LLWYAVVYIEPEWGIRDLLNAASNRLELNPAGEKIYNRNGEFCRIFLLPLVFTVDVRVGARVVDCLLIEDNDMLFISCGEKFIPPTAAAFKNSLKSTLPNLVGSYRVRKLLGRGGFGEVRIGQHIVSNEMAALKFIRRLDISDIEALDRTNNEIHCLTTLHHQNIISLVEHIESPEYIVLAFELMDGGDLQSFMRRRGNSPSEQRLTSKDARHVFAQLLSAVGFAHNQYIVHRDLKLENVL
jgi:serine/threonine protein kinase